MARDGRVLRGGLAWAKLPHVRRHPYPVLVNFLFRCRGKTVPPATHHLKERLRRDIQPSDDSVKRFLQLLAVLCSEPQNAAGNDGIYYFVKFL